MRKLVSCFLIALMFSASAMAAPLDDARAKGYVVEMPNGYIKATPIAPADIDKLVKEINEKRKQVYQQIAEKHGISVEQVGAESYRKRVKDGGK